MSHHQSQNISMKNGSTGKATESDKGQHNGKSQPQNDGKRVAQFNKSFSMPNNPENSGFAKPRSFRP